MEFKETLLESPETPVTENENLVSPYAFPEFGWERDFNATVWKTPPSGMYSLTTDATKEGNGGNLTVITRRFSDVGTIPENPYALFDEFRGHHISAITLPAPPSQVGGDRVFVIHAPDGTVFVVVSDAEGSGEYAARAGRIIHREMHSIILGCESVEEILLKANRRFLERGIRGAVVLAHIDGESVVLGAAGNPAPALIHDGEVEIIPVAGTLLGCTHAPQFDIRRVKIPSGGTILLFSDGVSEAESPSGQLFDVQCFGKVIDPGRSLAADLLACLDSVLSHCGDQKDDVSLSLIRGGLRSPAPMHREVRVPSLNAASKPVFEIDYDWYEPGVPCPADVAAVCVCR